jgi:hypothetical protein
MLNWFRRKRPAPVEAVRDFVDTIEFVNGLLARELAEREQSLSALRVGSLPTSPSATHASR